MLGGLQMNVIVHYPKKEEDIRELQKRVAEVHAQAVIRTIQALSCPKEQKLELIKDIKQTVASRQTKNQRER
jgi:hypothetical protein